MIAAFINDNSAKVRWATTKKLPLDPHIIISERTHLNIIFNRVNLSKENNACYK